MATSTHLTSQSGEGVGDWEEPAFRGGRRYSSSLTSGLAILEALQHPRGLAELADELGLGRSTTHRYLATLLALGYAEHVPGREYRLGLKGADIGRVMLDTHPLRVLARSHLRELRQRFGYTVSVAVLEGDTVRVLERLQGYRGHARLGLAIGSGSRVPAHCTGLGKALLANLPEGDSCVLIRSLRLRRHGPNTIRSKRELRRELLQVREAGFAVEDEELAAGVLSIAVPISAADELLGAVDVSAPASLIDRETIVARCRPHLLAASSQIASALTPDERRNNSADPPKLRAAT